MATSDDAAFDLPRLRVSFGFENDTRFLENDDNVAEFFDVKFCPYQPLDCDPIFAAVSKKHVVICRLSQNGDANPCQVISVIRDDDAEASACCCTWSKDPANGSPLICIGGVDAKVKIYDVIQGKLFKLFPGHGGDVNDLATSPVNSSIIASASDDTTVRVWSLDPKHSKQPLLYILAGEGHSWNLLSVAFHDTGRYILSAGHDQIINLWTLPDPDPEPREKPQSIHYPHFSTSAVHSGIVDCVAFYGDQILSRACHDNVISLWRIEGFSSSEPPPRQDEAPTPQSSGPTSTRSAFVPTISPQCPAQYTRLLEFLTPNCGPQFFMRFKLHCVPGQHPVLAFCNAAGNIFFWDFKRLTAFREFMKTLRDPDRDKSVSLRPPFWLKPIVHRQRIDPQGKSKLAGAEKDSKASAQVAPAINGKRPEEIPEFNAETLESWTARYSMEDPHEPLRAHKTESSSANFVGRQVAWSPGGEWCVVVGSSNTTLIMQRWAKRPLPRGELNRNRDSSNSVPVVRDL